MDGDADKLVADLLAFPGVQAAAHAHTDSTHLVANRDGAANGARGCIERSQKPIARSVDLAPLEAGELIAHDPVVQHKLLAPRCVAELGQAFGRADDVGEQDGREHAIGFLGGQAAWGIDAFQLTRCRRQDLGRDGAVAPRPARPAVDYPMNRTRNLGRDLHAERACGVWSVAIGSDLEDQCGHGDGRQPGAGVWPTGRLEAGHMLKELSQPVPHLLRRT